MEQWNGRTNVKGTIAAGQASGDSRPRAKALRRGGGVVLALFLVAFVLLGALFWAGLSLQGRLAGRRNAVLQTVQPVQQAAAPVSSVGLTTVELVELVGPSVVSIEVFANGWNRASANGSGVILSEDGYIVTNAHVVEGGDVPIRVTMHDGEKRLADVVGTDAGTDLAVLHIRLEGLVPATFGDSDAVQMGEQVMAIGNAAGILPGTPSLGIISGIGRHVPIQAMDGTVTNQSLLQTDAAINPGNSGGALVNMHGQVIGINVSKLQSPDIDNIGFAIPTNVAVPAINAILEEAALAAAVP